MTFAAFIDLGMDVLRAAVCVGVVIVIGREWIHGLHREHGEHRGAK